MQLLESQVKALQSRMKFLKERESQLLFVSPIDGKIISSYSPDTLLYAINYKQVVLHIPVKISDLSEFSKGQMLEISFSEIEETNHGEILSIDNEVKFMNGQQVVFISLLIDNKNKYFIPGMILENSLKLREVTLIEKISRLILR
jgi:hypothetical protein